MKLYGYYRSSATYRVRIALNFKKINYEQIHVHLLEGGGEQHSAEYLKLNPQPLVPTLVHGKKILTQSLSILEYLEENFPHPPLLPSDNFDRAKVRTICQIISSDIHPINNLRVLKYLSNNFQISEDKKIKWYHNWLKEGFDALEEVLNRLRNEDDIFCIGKTPTFADICLVPQIYNAIRYNFNMDKYPLLKKIYSECLKLDEFKNAEPKNDLGLGITKHKLGFFDNAPNTQGKQIEKNLQVSDVKQMSSKL